MLPTLPAPFEISHTRHNSVPNAISKDQSQTSETSSPESTIDKNSTNNSTSTIPVKRRPRRPRRSYNCGPCKKQKIKCDSELPCGACKRHNRADQCLASPPNPPSPDHKKRVRKMSVAALGEPVKIQSIIHQEESNGGSTSQHNFLGQHITSTPNGNIPAMNRIHQPDFKLPSLQSYTSTFKLGNSPDILLDAPKDNMIPLGQRMQQLSSTSISDHYLSSVHDNNQNSSSIPRPWERNSKSPSDYSKNTMFKPISSDAEVHHLRTQVSLLASKLLSMESKLDSLDQRDSIKLGIDDHIFNYLSTIPHEVSLDSPHNDSNGGLITKNINIKFLAPDKLANWDDFIKVIPDKLVLSKILQFFNLYINVPLNIIEAKTVEYYFNPQRLIKGKTVVSDDDWECLSLVTMVASLTVLTYPSHLIESQLNIKRSDAIYLSNTLFQVCKNCLHIVHYRETPKLIHLQILLLCSRYLQFFNKKNLLMTTNSELVSIAYALNLQSLIIPQNSLEVETSQKLWWIICYNDTMNSLKFKIPPLIRLENLPKAQIGDSHILKAFIPAQVSGFNSIITYIAKITKICNEIAVVSKQTNVEYVEGLVIMDRQLTALQIPHSFNLLNPRNDIITNFRICYLHFILILNRFEIYKKIFFTSKSSKSSSIWLIMVSIMENFFKKYTELRKMYPPIDHLNNYLQISDQLIISAIISLLILISDPEILPSGYRKIIHSYIHSVMEDLQLLGGSVFNETIPIYHQSFKILSKLALIAEKDSIDSQSEESQQKLMEVSSKLKGSKVLESMESEIGLVPNNDFFNLYLTSLFNKGRSAPQPPKQQETFCVVKEILNNDQIQFLRCIGV